MIRAATLGWLIGMGLLAGLVGQQGAGEVGAALGLAGWHALLLGVAHLGTLLADTLAWGALLGRGHRPALSRLIIGRWIGMSINGLLPVAQIGGEFARARLLSRTGVPGAVAGASVVVDLTIGLVTQIAFVALGLALLLWLAQADQGVGAARLIGALGVLGLMVAGFVLTQRRGLFGWAGRMLARAGRRPGWLEIAQDGRGLDQAIRRCYGRHRALAICAGWRWLAWLAGAVELWLGFAVLGWRIGWIEALILESMGQTARSVGFAIPGGLGVQEGGIVAAGLVLGVPPEIALAVGLLKRTRELAFGLPGLVVWPLVDARPPKPAAHPSSAR